VGLIDRQPALRHDLAVAVEAVHVAAIDLDDVAILVRRDGAAPDVVTTRQSRRFGRHLERFRVEALEPAKRRRAGKRRHRPAKKQLAWTAPDHHHVPAAIDRRRDLRGSIPRAQPADCRLLSAVSTTFDRPGRRIIAGQIGDSIKQGFQRVLTVIAKRLRASFLPVSKAERRCQARAVARADTRSHRRLGLNDVLQAATRRRFLAIADTI